MARPVKRTPVRQVDPALKSYTVDVSSTDDTLPWVSRSIYVGQQGDLVVRLLNDTADVTIPNAPVGYHPLCVTVVRHAGTNAAGIRAFA